MAKLAQVVRQALSGPMLYRAAKTEGVIDAEKRIVRVSFSSEVKVKRVSWFEEPWIEVLGHKPEEIDLSRFNEGAGPALYGHNSYERVEHVGVIERAWIENGKAYAEVRLSMRPDVSDLWKDIVDGIVRNVSAGYQILERTLTKKNEKGPNEYRVTRWLPMELSFCSVPADATVGVGRSADTQGNFTITDIEETNMSKPAEAELPARDGAPDAGAAPAGSGPANTAVADAVRKATDDAQRAERTRVMEINDAVTRSKAPQEIATNAVTNGLSIDKMRALIIDHFASKDVNHTPGRIEGGHDSRDKFRDGVSAWLMFRYNEKVEGKPIVLTGNEYRGMKLLDIARRALEIAGVDVRGLTGLELAQRAISHSTSDFPIALQNVMHKTLLNSYNLTPDTWRRFCAIGSLSDFRAHNRYRSGSFNDLVAVTENNEFQDGTIPDGEREQITAGTKGRILNISRQMIVNDDMGFFLFLARLMGRAGKRTIEKDVFALLAQNSNTGPTLGDGVVMFHTTHANVAATPALPTVASFDAARVQMASQTDPGGKEITDLRPAVWLGPLGQEGDAKVVNESTFDPDASNKLQRINKSRSTVRDIVGTARLTGTRWYMFADPNEDPVIEVGFLDGQQEPVIEMQEGFRVDGVSWKVRLDYGTAGVGFRGAVTNAGS